MRIGSKFSIFFVIFLLSIGLAMPVQAEEKNTGRLGITIGDFSFNFYRLQSIFAFGNQPEESKVKDTLDLADSLRSLLKDVEAPKYLWSRLHPIKQKVKSFAKPSGEENEPVKTFYFKSKENISLEGGEIETLSLPGEKGEYNYLKISDREGKAVLKGDTSVKDLKQKFTVEFWVKPRTEDTKNLISSGNWKIGLSDSLLKLTIDTGIESSSIKPGFSLPTDFWSHLALVKKEDEASLYLNGLKAKTEGLPVPPNMGSEIHFGPGFLGAIDDLRIYDRPLDISDIGFTKPPGYILTEPTMNWVNRNLEASERWRFIGGLIISGMIRKEELGKLKTEDLRKLNNIFQDDLEGIPEPPKDLPERVKDSIKEIEKLSEANELSEKKQKRAEDSLYTLKDYFMER